MAGTATTGGPQDGDIVAFDTYPEHWLLAWGGTLHGTEIWSNSLRMVPNTGAAVSSEDAEAFLADFQTDVTTFFGTGVFHNQCKVEWAKFNKIGSDGRYASDSESNTRVFAAAVPGTGTGGFPPQISCAVTLLTDADRGLASKGRFFLAGLASDTNAFDLPSGRLSTGRRDLIKTSVTAFLDNVNNMPGLDSSMGGFDVHIVSQGNAFRNGVARKVTGIKVGRVLDTQRRRRNNLVEDYGSIAPLA